MDLQHEVHYLNNQLNPILDGEEDGPDMLVEDDGWDEEEVELEEGMILSLTSTVIIMWIRLLKWLVETLDVSSLFM